MENIIEEEESSKHEGRKNVVSEFRRKIGNYLKKKKVGDAKNENCREEKRKFLVLI